VRAQLKQRSAAAGDGKVSHTPCYCYHQHPHVNRAQAGSPKALVLSTSTAARKSESMHAEGAGGEGEGGGGGREGWGGSTRFDDVADDLRKTKRHGRIRVVVDDERMATENRRGGVQWHLHQVETATAQQNENVGRPLHGGKNNAGAGQSGVCRHLGPHVKERALCEAAEGVEEEEEEDEGKALRGRGGGGTGGESLGRGELR
jgi:hypothetical protein